MGGRVGCIFVIFLAASLACDAREFSATLRNKASEVSVLRSKAERRFEVGRNEVCNLCEEFAGEALHYLQQNKTQTEIIDMLHKSCSRLHSLEQQCILLVDYYAPLFFFEISTIHPEDFCEKVALCEVVVAYGKQFSQSSCDLCHLAVSEVVSLLKDPDNQLEILQLLLKECSAVEKFLPKCKTMVFEYAPLILANAEQFLEKQDVCAELHACDSATVITHEQSSMEKPSSLSDH